MKPGLPIRAASAAIFLVVGSNVRAATPVMMIERGVSFGWPTLVGNTYQPQWSPASGGPWTNLGAVVSGNGATQTFDDTAGGGLRIYRVLEIVPGSDPVPAGPVNAGFEAGSGIVADHWTTGGGQPPARSGEAAHLGASGMSSALTNVGSSPAEGLLYQLIAAQGGAVSGGHTYDFSFWAKQIGSGPSYVQQYQVQWLNASNVVVGGTGVVNFNGVQGTWVKISKPALVAPAGTVEARLSFRFATGAVAGGHGEVFIDDVLLDDGSATSGSPGHTDVLAVAAQPVAKLKWSTEAGVSYQPWASPDLLAWTAIPPVIVGDGNPKVITVPITNGAGFFRLGIPIAVVSPPTGLHTVPSGIGNAIGLAWNVSPTIGVTGYRIRYGISSGNLDQTLDVGNVTTATLAGLLQGQTYFISVSALTVNGESPAGDATLSAQPDVASGIVALFNSTTVPEPATTIDTPTALVTRVGDRARDRHAREAIYHAYDHYLTWYWEERTIGIEIIDHVAKGGTGITFNYQTLTPLGAPEFRAFFRGINTVAEYHGNYSAPLVGTNLYSQTLTSKLPENRPLQIGDRVEIEVSQFIQAATHGRNNYYGTVMLYIVGQGIVPWEASGALQDSSPLPQTAWLGGKTTLPYQYSNEPEHRFKQTAGNISPSSIQPFMLGRRLHHTDFGDGTHSEPGNPVYAEQVGKLGPKFIARSCVECHVNNGRALPPAIGAPMTKSVVKVGSNSTGSPHSTLGSVLQPQSTSGAAEGSAVIASYINSSGQYGDGAPWSLRKPTYSFQGTTPAYFSVRLTPPLVGMGLLEAVAENTIVALSDPDDVNHDGISGRIQTVLDPQTGQQRLGRFTYKAGKARVSQQVAGALNTDMGVTTSIFPTLDGETASGTPEVAATELDEMTRYISLLGVGARRDLIESQALRGEQMFTAASCFACHTPTLATSPYHPMAELRDQVIHPYTDLLLHDMGAGLADNMGEGSATGSEWRTPALWNIGLTSGVSGGEAYLHDGRARNLEEAILWHGGEAEASKQAFVGMPAADRAALVAFLKSL
ncbi:MAG: di-heme oxidoredictase family protein [Luteolibacter sp.]|uniref:di-heme oxidoredictase family protein n=1 Tax=Luteolibacter sp. TaxID=1962973 RepID=UPI003266589D